jgi:mono/diheme cytochrome c family protein
VLLLLVLIVARGTVALARTDRSAALPSGRTIFARECSGCHTLAAETRGRLSGGSLRDYRLTVRQIESFVRVMPVRRRLTAREVVAVSEYVAQRESVNRR